MHRMALGVVLTLALGAEALRADYLEVDRKTAVRSQPSSSSARVRNAVAGEQLQLLDAGAQQNGYYHVALAGSQGGWIYRTFVRRYAGDMPASTTAGAGTGTGATGAAAGTTSVAGTTIFSGAFVQPCVLPYADFAQQGLTVDAQCPPSGTGDAGSQAQNLMKNNLCAKSPALSVTFADLKTLQAESDKLGIKHGSRLDPDRSKLRDVTFLGDKPIGEGTLVRLAGFVMDAHYSNVSGGETVNCKLTGKDNNDIHVTLMPEAPSPGKKLDECRSVTAEIIPHFRPWFWEPQNLQGLDRPLRFSGSLTYDAAHRPCTPEGKGSPKRSVSWEVHPVYQIDVCNENKLEQCPANDDSKWTPLQVFKNLEEELDEGD